MFPEWCPDASGLPVRIRRNTQTDAKTQHTGDFKLLLETYPQLDEFIKNKYFPTKNNKLAEKCISVVKLHKLFLDECRRIGIKVTNYPFCTKYKGVRSLQRYVKYLKEHYPHKAANRFGENAARKHELLGKGNSPEPILEFLECVNFDAHRIDGYFIIKYTTRKGCTINILIERLWILAIIDCATELILSFIVVPSLEYTEADVIECIKKAVIPWMPIQFTIDGFEYPKGGGFAQQIFPGLDYAAWNNFQCDNAKANISKFSVDRLCRIIGCKLNPGPIKAPERRFLIEHFFLVLEQHGFHCLPNTTGSNPQDPRRDEPEKAAKQYEITVNELQEIAELLIAEYNCRPNRGLDGLSPREALMQKYDPDKIRKISEIKRRELLFLTIEIKRTVRGSQNEGRRPYIYYEGVSYRNDVLASSYWLIKKELTLIVDTENICTVHAFMEDGSDLGILQATGGWWKTPHSLKTRKEINKLCRDNILNYNADEHTDPIEMYRAYLASKETKKAGSKLAKTVHDENKSKKRKILHSEPVIVNHDNYYDKNISEKLPLSQNDNTDQQDKEEEKSYPVRTKSILLI